jgi:hypothetical protein
LSKNWVCLLFCIKTLSCYNRSQIAYAFFENSVFGKYSYQSDEVESKSQEFIREPNLELYLEKMYLKRNNFAEALKQHYEKECVR